MKKILIIAVVLAIAGFSACKKDASPSPVQYKLKSIQDIKEHTGWERDDSTSTGQDGGTSLLRTASPTTTTTTTTTTPASKTKPIKK